MENIAQTGKVVGVIQIFWGLVRTPSRTFDYLKDNPTVLAPFLLRACVLIIFILISAPLTAKLSLSQLSEQAGQIPPQQLESAAELIRSPLLMLVGAISSLAGLAVVWLLQAGIFNLIGSAWGNGRSYKVSLSIVAHSWLPLIFREILQSLTMLFSGEMVRPGLSALLSIKTLTSRTPFSVFLSYIDLFSIWNLVLLILGLSTIHKISRRKASIIVVGYFLVTVSIAILSTSITGFIAG